MKRNRGPADPARSAPRDAVSESVEASPPEPHVLADGRVVVLPRALRGASPEAVRAALHVQELARRRADLDAQLERAVAAGRYRGMSWASLGWCLGISGEAVRKAYGPPSMRGVAESGGVR